MTSMSISLASLVDGGTNREGAVAANATLNAMRVALDRAASDAPSLRDEVGDDYAVRLAVAVELAHDVALAAERLHRALRREATEERQRALMDFMRTVSP